MAVLAIEGDRVTRNKLSHLLNEMGFQTLWIAQDVSEALSLLQRETRRTFFILCDWNSFAEPDLPISRFLTQNPRFDPTPLIVTAESYPNWGLSQTKSRHSRVDGYLSKPFGRPALEKAITEAFRRRSRMRDVLLTNSFEVKVELEKPLQNHHHHWKSVIIARSGSEFTQALADLRFRVGGLLLEGRDLSHSDVEWIRHFKRTPLGTMTPLACLYRSVEDLYSLRSLADAFYHPRRMTWSSMLVRLSGRLIQHWEFTRRWVELQRSMRTKNLPLAKKQLRAFDREQFPHWEIREAWGEYYRLKGKPYRAVQSYRAALRGNPCSPRAQLGLLECLETPSTSRTSQRALRYCPDHPQIRANTGLGDASL